MKPSHIKINQCFYFCSSPLADKSNLTNREFAYFIGICENYCPP
nr:MAG TPA: Riboflavin-binding protein Egg, Riboflavin, Transport, FLAVOPROTEIN [Bacteriophage sp.]